ncbi:hypothetical protein LTS18_008243 [Coniosporium uncinatum]|uniref:Uncharacterized protein n=1 Tax=Coniosporium uncinatum TaxID=93489 RepID=A0ACC3D1N9_9PEZI|nr:hypothetical protein LTS18_008243 [Coniosporium uncinatum]
MSATTSLSARKIAGVRLPSQSPSSLWDLTLAHGKIESLHPHADPKSDGSRGHDVLDAHECLLAPSLCHAHIHLDKCFLLQDPKFSDLQIVDGDFKEAMSLTTQAKQRFEEDDLMRRGRRLIEESVAYGVTAMRAFVEVDGDVGMKCLDAGLKLKEEFKARCHVQICAFAQLPLFSGSDDGETVRESMLQAAERDGVDVLGSTPYVEQDNSKMDKNIDWIIQTALKYKKMLDLHLDYHLDESMPPFVWKVLITLKTHEWQKNGGHQITFGHCTRLTYFTPNEWERLKMEMVDLPIAFVGLPTSDLFMMRTPENYRGTMNVPRIIQDHGFEAAIAVNNIGNAFTPQGNCDPLAIASLGVGVYQAGTKKDAEVLYECVSSRAREAIGLPATSLSLKVGEPADFVIFEKGVPAWRGRKAITEVVYDPPPGRTTIYRGSVLSK